MRVPILLLLAVLSAGAQTLLENDQVRVLKAVDQPHVKTKPHEHKVNRVMVYLTAGKQEFVSGGKTTTQEWKAGQAAWSPAGPTHTAEVVSGAPLSIIEIELKKPSSGQKTEFPALDPVKVEPKLYHVEFENPQVRVVRVHMGPKQQVKLHEHVLNRVVVYLTDQDGTMTVDGKTDHAVHKAGEVSWGGPTKHSEANVASHPFEAIVVELKN
jgi:quercetin dioxygenase-like cupin family protein